MVSLIIKRVGIPLKEMCFTRAPTIARLRFLQCPMSWATKPPAAAGVGGTDLEDLGDERRVMGISCP